MKNNYSPGEETEMKSKVVRILKSFEDLGWVYFINQEEIHFEIMTTIDRISKLYGDVINDVDNLQAYFGNEQLS